MHTSKAPLLSVWEGGTCHSIVGLGSNGPGRILGRNAKICRPSTAGPVIRLCWPGFTGPGRVLGQTHFVRITGIASADVRPYNGDRICGRSSV